MSDPTIVILQEEAPAIFVLARDPDNYIQGPPGPPGDGSAFVPDATTTTPGRVALATATDINNNTDTGKVITVEALLGSTVIKRQAKATIGNGTDSAFPISHTFNTFDVDVRVRRTAGDRADVYPDITRTSSGSVTVTFSYVPTAGEFTVLLEAY